MAKFREMLLISSVALLLFVTPGKTGLLNPTRFRVISKQCYYCMGDNERGAVDNIEACSTENHLEIENCPIQDRFDKCIVFQAFSRSKNITIFKRECTSERFCTEGTLCSDPDFSSCRFECCTGDLCNDFDFKSDTVSLTTTQPSVVEITTKDAAQTTMISSEATASLKATTTPQTQQKTEQGNPFPKTTKSSAERDRRTTEFESVGGPTFGPSETSDCVDIDKMCSSYVSKPSHLVYYCEDNKDYMMVYCQRTCKYCNERPHTAATTEQIPTTKRNSEECVDKDPRCRSYVGNAMYLPQFCEDNKSYTSAVCRKSCKFCKGTRTDTNTPKPISTTTKPTSKATTSKPRPRRTVRPSLNTAKPTLKTTQVNKDTFQGGIPVAKSSPTPDQTFTSNTTSTNEDCKDRRTSCQMYKTMNFCRVQKWYMEQNCPRTCNFCSGKDNSNTTTPKPTSSSPELTSTTPETTASTTPEATESTTPETTASTTPEATASTSPEATASTTPEPTESTTPEPTESTTPEPTESTTPEPTESTTPEPTESSTPEPTESTTPEPTESTTPEPTESTTPEATESTTPEPTASTTPEPTASITPEATASTTPEATASTTPKLASTTPEPTESTTPEPTESTTPEPTESTTPEATESTTPEPTASTTPAPTASITPEATASTTPEATASTTPKLASTTPEPTESTTPEPTESTTPEPTESTTPEATESTTPEPTASTTPEPTASTTPKLASTTPEPTESTTPEPTESTTPGPTASTTPEPTASTTPEATASTTPEPTASTTPEPTASTTPEPTASTTPEPTASSTPEPTSKATTSQPGQNKTTHPTSKSSTPYQDSTTKTTSTKDCKDERPIGCAIYAKISGYCQYTERFMRKHCPKSCGFCSPGGVAKITTLNPPPIPTTKSKSTPLIKKASTTEEATESPQSPTINTTSATATASTTDNGNSLRWIIMSWGECVKGVQSRVVRCYDFHHGKDYHVTIHACMKSVGEMPSKTRNC